MRKVFLNNLPRYKNKDWIDWVGSIGHEVEFIYDEIVGKIKIENYDKASEKLTLIFNDERLDVNSTKFKQCILGQLIGKHHIKYKYKINETIIGKYSSIQIIELFRSGKMNSKTYKYKCLQCGNIDDIFERKLIEGQGCNVCSLSSKKIIRGVNDIWTTDCDVAKHLVDKEDGFKYSSRSHKKLLFRCLYCNFRGLKSITKITRDIRNTGNFPCPQCSDGISFPERVVYGVLTQIGETFDYQKTFSWSKNYKHINNSILDGDKRYDFYIHSKNCIIEVHGSQHYREEFVGMGRSLEIERENDTIKKYLSGKNGIQNYIIIKCDKSDFEYIKRNIVSELDKIFNISDVDWNNVLTLSCTPMIKEASQLFNDGFNLSVIADKMRLARSTISRYLKKGASIGWCTYRSEESRNNGLKMGRAHKRKETVMLNLNGEYINEFESVSEASRQLKIGRSDISSVCRGEKKTAGGFKWMYKDDYEKSII